MASADELLEKPGNTAFVSFVDENYIQGFLTLLRSLVLNNPWIDRDYVVLHDRLPVRWFRRIRQLYPRIVPVQVETEIYKRFTKGNRANYLYEKAYYILELFKLRGYARVIALDTDMVVLGDIASLLQVKGPFAAVPQFFDSDRGRKLNSGLLVVDKELLGGALTSKIERTGNEGSYELEKHDQGILTSVFDGDYVQLHHRYNAVKRRFRGKKLPSDVVILHFTGAIKPWTCAERGYEALQSAWEQYDLVDDIFLDRAAVAATKAGNHELAVYYCRQYLLCHGRTRRILELTYPSFDALGLSAEWLDVLGDERTHVTASSPRLNRQVAKALLAVEGTASAEALLRLAAGSLDGERRSSAALTNVLWTEKRTSEGRRLATARFRARPFSRATHVALRRVDTAEELERSAREAGNEAIVHAAFYMNAQGNAGDVLLPTSVRAALRSQADAAFSPLHVHQRVQTDTIRSINSKRGLVVGGGGLFLRDTAPNPNSGWQWNISEDQLAEIDVPIAVFAVGYNRFAGQREFAPVFRRHVTRLVEKACFVGLRNHGSIRAFREYLPAELEDKVEFQPCPTTVAWRLFPEALHGVERKDYIALNLALDRPSLRFGAGYENFLREVGEFVRQLSKTVEVRFFAHAVVDEQAVLDLARVAGVSLRCERLHRLDDIGILQKYGEPMVAIGMRGHAGMIPFGCRTPIVSLISHPKLRYFLDDVDMNPYGVDVNEPHLAEKVGALVSSMLDEHASEVEKVERASEPLWRATRDNAARIMKAMSS